MKRQNRETKFVHIGSILDDILKKYHLDTNRELVRVWQVWDRIVEGRVEKFLDDHCLLRQVYIRDDNLTVEKLLLDQIAFLGENIIIRRFARWGLGEGDEN